MTQEQPKKKSNLVALIWSIAQPGLGHFYLGNNLLALAFIVINIFFHIHTGLNKIIISAFSGNFKRANSLFIENPTILFPSLYCFVMWHAYNYDIIARKGSPREYRLTGFFSGLAFGGVYGESYKFLGTYIMTGLAVGLATGLVFHLIEKLILYITREK
jgi:hypothetical protein